jgi:SOS-response transcriptional repressors (RecA-mediated autopeptidases)
MEDVNCMKTAFAIRLKEAMDLRKMKQVDLVEKTKIGKSAISQYLTGKFEPKQNNIYKIARALGVSEAWLMGHDVPMEKTNEQLTISNIFPIKKEQVPLLETVTDGQALTTNESFEVYTESKTVIQADFCLRFKGDSMKNARIHDGDIIFVQAQPDVCDGEIAAVLINDAATLKRVYKMNDMVQLQAENSKYKPLIFAKENCSAFKILGKAVAFQSNLL